MQGMVQTENFFCVLTMQSYILSKNWAIASAEAKKLI